MAGPDLQGRESSLPHHGAAGHVNHVNCGSRLVFFYQTCLCLGQTLQSDNVFPILPRFCSGGDLRTLIRNQRDEE